MLKSGQAFIRALSHPFSKWVFRTLLYLFILVGLLALYGFEPIEKSTFIYNEF